MIKPDEQVKEEIEPPKVEELKNSTPSDKTQEGNTDNLNEVIATGSGNAEVGDKPDEVVTWVPEQATFKDGDLNAFLRTKMNYPAKATERGTSGRVFVEFIIEPDGSVTNVRVSKGIGDGCDEEAMRVIKLTSGKWTPGKNNGNPVRLRKIQPIYFKLAEQ